MRTVARINRGCGGWLREKVEEEKKRTTGVRVRSASKAVETRELERNQPDKTVY